jgi:drug/metabolite transporter (DMT)-like permease
VITLGCTALFALHIALMSVYARRYDVRKLTVLQITVAAVIIIVVWFGLRLCVNVLDAETLPAAIAREATPLVWNLRVVWQLVYLALVGTVVAFFFWTWGQARTSATHAAIIFSLEPVFATAFAVAVRGANEWLGGRAGAGAALIFAGIIISEVRWSERGEEEVAGESRKAEGREPRTLEES